MNIAEALRLFDDKLFGTDTDITKRNIASLLSKYWETEKEKDEILASFFRSDLYPHPPTENKDLHQVLIKVTLLNSFYSTFLNNTIADGKGKPFETAPPLDIVTMSKLIVKLAKEKNFDELINEGSLEAVKFIRNSAKEAGYRDAYSFATKYCSWHKPDKYPIVDSLSKDMVYYLMRYIEQREVKISEKKLIDSLSKDGCYHLKYYIEQREPPANEKNLKQVPTRIDLDDYSVFCGCYEAIQDFFEKCDIYLSYKAIDMVFWEFGRDNLRS